MTGEYTETVFPVNRHYTSLDVPIASDLGDYAGMDFAANLKQLRQARGLTQGQLGELIEVAQATIQRWESGAREPSHEDLIRIARALDVSVADLFRDSGAEPVPTEDELARMIERAMGVLPVGVSFGDYPQAVSSSLREQLKQYQVAGGYQDGGEESVLDTGAQPPKPTKPNARAKSRTP